MSIWIVDSLDLWEKNLVFLCLNILIEIWNILWLFFSLLAFLPNMTLKFRYPHCLFFLELLQNAHFRNAMAHPGNKVNFSFIVFLLCLELLIVMPLDVCNGREEKNCFWYVICWQCLPLRIPWLRPNPCCLPCIRSSV